MKIFLFNAFLIIHLITNPTWSQDKTPDQTLIDEILDLSKTPSEKVEKHYSHQGYQVITPSWSRLHPIYGYVFAPNLTIRSIFRHENEIIWNKTYHTENYMSRSLPAPLKRSGPKRSLVVMGCSIVFGVGLNDNETIMANLAKALPSYQIGNISLIGSGPNSTLSYLQNENDPSLYTGKDDIFIYNFSESEHLGRSNGFMIELAWLSKTPYYEEVATDDGPKMVSKGNFVEARPITTSVLNFLRESTFNTLSGIHIPPIFDFHRRRVCLMFKQMQQSIVANNPNAKFFVFFYPMAAPPNPYYKECFDKYGVSYLPESHEYKDLEKLMYPYDHHPNPQGAEYISETLIKSLREARAI